MERILTPVESRAAVARILQLHQEYRDGYAVGDERSCAHCNQFAGDIVRWPCPTIRALYGDALEPEDPGEAARHAAGIDGSMGDAQDISHAFRATEHGYCLLCGLSEDYRKHRYSCGTAIGDMYCYEQGAPND